MYYANRAIFDVHEKRMSTTSVMINYTNATKCSLLALTLALYSRLLNTRPHSVPVPTVARWLPLQRIVLMPHHVPDSEPSAVISTTGCVFASFGSSTHKHTHQYGEDDDSEAAEGREGDEQPRRKNLCGRHFT